jgi:hypothetical protein
MAAFACAFFAVPMKPPIGKFHAIGLAHLNWLFVAQMNRWLSRERVAATLADDCHPTIGLTSATMAA